MKGDVARADGARAARRGAVKVYNPAVIELSRTVRFCLNDTITPHAVQAGRHNTFSAWPPMQGLGRYYELDVLCRGEADPATGYFINIKHVDDAVRQRALPLMHKALQSQPDHDVPVAGLLADVLEALQPQLKDAVERVRLRLTPFLSVGLRRDDMAHVLIRQQYEFSAAHRLHVDTLSDEENRQVFGKCNNPAGHGHNYRLEVVVAAAAEGNGRLMQPHELDAIVDKACVQKLDHKHLNQDVPQFAELNPSVENIVKVAHDMLKSPLAEAGATLEEVSVWETSKTMCTYRP